MKRHALLVVIIAIMAGVLAGCGQPATSTPAPATAPASSEVPAVLGGDKTALQTLVPADMLSDAEIQAGARGVATYTGYACTIAPIGCACDDAVVQDSQFTFTADNQLIYDFTIKGGQPAQWQLDHAGPNQWSYSAPVTVGEGEQDAILLALLSFNPNGYMITEVATFATGEVSKCPNLEFHLLGAP